MIFPTGSRYSADMKGGAILIAKLAKAPIVPAVYQGPGSFGHYLNVSLRLCASVHLLNRLKVS